MRESKFRGKRIDTGEWVFGDLVSCSKKHAYIVTYFEKGEILSEEALTACKCVIYKVKVETVGQFIANEDDNDIYEGDKIQEIKHGRIIREFFARDIRTFIKEYNNTERSSIFKVIGSIHDQKAEV